MLKNTLLISAAVYSLLFLDDEHLLTLLRRYSCLYQVEIHNNSECRHNLYIFSHLNHKCWRKQKTGNFQKMYLYLGIPPYTLLCADKRAVQYRVLNLSLTSNMIFNVGYESILFQEKTIELGHFYLFLYTLNVRWSLKIVSWERVSVKYNSYFCILQAFLHVRNSTLCVSALVIVFFSLLRFLHTCSRTRNRRILYLNQNC